jgi:hypothetical protein
MGLKQIALAMGVGYVLGTKAGEQRYEQLKDLWARTGRPLLESPSVQHLGERGKDAVSRAAEAAASRAQTGGRRFMSAARERGGPPWVAAASKRGFVD